MADVLAARDLGKSFYYWLRKLCTQMIEASAPQLVRLETLSSADDIPEIQYRVGKRKTGQRLAADACSVRQYPQHSNLSFRLQGRNLAHWEMDKNGAESAGNLQTGTA